MAERPQDRDQWETPGWLFSALCDVLSRRGLPSFTIDAAASAENTKLPRYWTVSDNALDQSWAGERVFVNPPFTNSAWQVWVEKAWREFYFNSCQVVAMILPASVDTKAFHDYIWPCGPWRASELFIPRGRVRFEYKGEVIGSPFQPTVCPIWWRI